MSIVGTWDVAIKTPVGSMHVEYTFVEREGAVAGTAAGKSETVPLTDVVVADDHGQQLVSWRQTITKPLRLKLDFDVRVQDDQFTGHSRAGRLPRSAVTAVRRR